MGIFSGTTRRKFLKNVAAGAVAAATTKSGLIVPAWAAEKVPPGKKLFKDVKLKYFQDFELAACAAVAVAASREGGRRRHREPRAI